MQNSNQLSLVREDDDNRGSGRLAANGYPEHSPAVIEPAPLSSEHALWVVHNRAPYQ